jgi:hypothetical protein
MSRKRYAYTMGGVPLAEPVEVSEDYRGGDGRMPLFGDGFMANDTAPDGTDISSRAKRREWMSANGVTEASDYATTNERHAKRRTEYFQGRHTNAQMGEAIARALHGSRK